MFKDWYPADELDAMPSAELEALLRHVEKGTRTHKKYQLVESIRKILTYRGNSRMYKDTRHIKRLTWWILFVALAGLGVSIAVFLTS